MKCFVSFAYPSPFSYTYCLFGLPSQNVWRDKAQLIEAFPNRNGHEGH